MLKNELATSAWVQMNIDEKRKIEDYNDNLLMA